MPLASSGGTKPRRDSLPSTLPSSTVATKEKVARRRSYRRSIAAATHSSSNNNNNNNESSLSLPPLSNKSPNVQYPPYSPPETRSAKKKKTKAINEAFFHNHLNNHVLHGTVLAFSPPNQKENERKENERIQKLEQERLQRIEQARSNGRLLVYSPSNKSIPIPPTSSYCLNLSPSQPAPHTKETVKNDAGKDASSLQQMELLQKLHENVNKLLSERRDSSDAAAEESSQQVLLEKLQAILAVTQQKEHASSDTTTNHLLLLQETNAKLVNDLQHLTQQLVDSKASSAAWTTKFELYQANTQTQFSEFQSRQAQLESENQALVSEKLALQQVVQRLERELDAAQSQLGQWKARLEDTTNQQETQLQDWQVARKQLESTNQSLQHRLENLERENTKLVEKNENFQQSIQIYETQTVPEIQAQLHDAKNRLADLESLIRIKESEMTDSTTLLQNSLQEVRDQLESKLAELQTVQKQLERLQEERNNMVEAQKEEQAKLIQEQTMLNKALEETMQEMEVIEAEKRQLEKRLTQMTQNFEAFKSNLAHKDLETSETVIKLSEQLTEEIQQRQEFQKQNEELRRQLHETRSERDLAKSSMESFSERENQLYQRVVEGERIRRQMHSKLLTLMGNIRVFVRVRLPPACDSHSTESNDKNVCLKKRKRESDDEATPFRFPGLDGSLEEKQQQQQPDIFSSGKSGDDLTKNWLEIQEPFKDRGGLQNRQRTWRFGFDGVFQPHHTNNDVWESTEPLIQCAVDGSNVTVFAYGQTGSGKTHTMLGGRRADGSADEGIIGRSIRKMFSEKREIEALSRGNSQVAISVELLEVYNEKVRDLLSPEIHQDLKVTSNNDVVGNIVVETKTEQEVLKVLEIAQSRRCTKATDSNSVSSRSHMVFTLHFVVTDTRSQGSIQRAGKLHICDLAGSERLHKSGVSGGTLLEESKNINKSLSVLSNVIERLQSGDKNVPFRESKLTFLLQNSLRGNNAKTLAIVCCHGSSEHFSESLGSLRFAEKVNRIELKQQPGNVRS